MTMTGLKISKTLLAVMLTSAVATGSAYAENATTDKAQSGVESAGQKVDSSMNKVGNFMDDSTITAKVKAALVDHDSIKSTDISVKTDQKVVTLSGFVESQAQAEEAVKVAKGVEGVTSVSDKLHVRDSKETSVKGYAGDTAITSEVKAKLLADDIQYLSRILLDLLLDPLKVRLKRERILCHYTSLPVMAMQTSSVISPRSYTRLIS